MRAIREGQVVILPVHDSNLIDVFTGMGWTKWSRFNVIKGHPKYVRGESLTDADYKILCGLLK